MLNKISQSQKDNYYMNPLICGTCESSNSQTTRGWGEWGMGSYSLMGTEFQYFKIKSVLELGWW